MLLSYYSLSFHCELVVTSPKLNGVLLAKRLNHRCALILAFSERIHPSTHERSGARKRDGMEGIGWGHKRPGKRWKGATLMS